MIHTNNNSGHDCRHASGFRVGACAQWVYRDKYLSQREAEMRGAQIYADFLGTERF